MQLGWKLKVARNDRVDWIKLLINATWEVISYKLNDNVANVSRLH